MICSEMNKECKKAKCLAFTLIELIVVLTILATMTAIVLPYGKRSNKHLKVKQECLNLAGILTYSINYASEASKPTRTTIDLKRRIYFLEAASSINSSDFMIVPVGGRELRPLSQNLYVTNIDGFEVNTNGYYIVFDPLKPWPKASISLSDEETTHTIIIDGKRIEVADSTF